MSNMSKRYVSNMSNMSQRYHPRKKGSRLESVVYRESRQTKKVFPTPIRPYYKSSSKSKSKSKSPSTRKIYQEYRKKEVFPTLSINSKSKSRSRSRKKREKLHKLRNAHGQNQINYANFWR